MGVSIKCLWAQFLTKKSRMDRFHQHIIDTGVNAVCVRSESLSKDLIAELQAKKINGKPMKVFGWCYPRTRPGDSGPDDPSFGPNQASLVSKLVGYGLDGYVFDIEDGTHGEPNDWSGTGDSKRAVVGQKMVSDIVGAFQKRGGPYMLGLTSHQWGFGNYEGVPWQIFLDECNVLFPQTYWRADHSGTCNPVSYDYAVHPAKVIGTVDQGLKNGFEDYANKKDKNGNVLPIIPLVGELGCAKKGEITRAWQIMQAKGIDQLHIYVDVEKPGWIDGHPPKDDPTVLDEIKAIV